MKKVLLLLTSSLLLIKVSAQPYLPLSGGTLTGGLSINNGYFVMQSGGTNTNASGSSAVVIGSGSGTDYLNYVYGNNPYAIWTNNVKRFVVDGSGNVGIGLSNPLSLLNVSGGGYRDVLISSTGNVGAGISLNSLGNGGRQFTLLSTSSSAGVGGGKFGIFDETSQLYRFVLDNNGWVGIGTTPITPFDVKLTTNQHVQFIQNVGGYSGAAGIVSVSDDNSRYTPLGFYASSFFWGGGNVGIGTTNPDQKLTVNGTIHSTQVKVDLNIPGPDYVFKKDYNLSALSEVKTYIDKNHHLSEIPSAAQMEKNGVDLGEMNIKLLKKVEELTLYLINQNRRIDVLEKQIKNNHK